MGKFLLAFLEKGKILKGEREKPIYWCMLFELTLFFSFLIFFPFLSVFVLIFFLFLLLCFSFHLMRYTLCFSAPSTGHGKGLFIVPAVTSVLLSCPLTPLCLAWVYLPTILCDAEPLPDRGGLIFCPPVHRGLSCHDVNLFSPHTQSMHSTVPSQIASFGWSIIPAGRTSQKRLEQGP